MPAHKPQELWKRVYDAGYAAYPDTICPYSRQNTYKFHAWWAGWHDKDMETPYAQRIIRSPHGQ